MAFYGIMLKILEREMPYFCRTHQYSEEMFFRKTVQLIYFMFLEFFMKIMLKILEQEMPYFCRTHPVFRRNDFQ